MPAWVYVAFYLGLFALAVRGVRVRPEQAAGTQPARAPAIRHVVAAFAIAAVALLWVTATFRERRQAAGGAGALIRPWISPLAGVAALLALAVVLDAAL